jgi:hypothetical protein
MLPIINDKLIVIENKERVYNIGINFKWLGYQDQRLKISDL